MLGSRAEDIRRTTEHWQPKEREAVQRLFLAWQADQAPNDDMESFDTAG